MDPQTNSPVSENNVPPIDSQPSQPSPVQPVSNQPATNISNVTSQPTQTNGTLPPNGQISLDNNQPVKNPKKHRVFKIILIIIGVIIGLFILLVIIGSFLPETTTSSQNQKTETSNVPAGEKMFQSNKFSIVLPDSAKISPANGDADSLYASYVLPYGTIYVDIADKGAAILNSGKKSTTYYNVKVTEIPMTISGVQTTVLAVDGRNKLPEKSDVLLINGEYNTQDFESKTTNPYIVNYGVRVMSTTKLSDAQMAEFRNEYDKITKSLIFKN